MKIYRQIVQLHIGLKHFMVMKKFLMANLFSQGLFLMELRTLYGISASQINLWGAAVKLSGVLLNYFCMEAVTLTTLNRTNGVLITDIRLVHIVFKLHLF